MAITRFLFRTSIQERIVGFSHHMRDNGVTTTPLEVHSTLRLLRLIDITNIEEVRLALKSVFTNNKESFVRFNDLFDSYWLNDGKQRHDHKAIDPSNKKGNLSQNFPNLFEVNSSKGTGKTDVPDDEKDGETESSGEGKLIAAKIFNKTTTDMREFVLPEDENKAAEAARRIANAIRYRWSRRRKASKKGGILDMRRIMRKSISTGGEPLKLPRKRRPDLPMHLIGLVDVSGSMQPYARVFLSFMKGLISNDMRTDAFLFHTKLMCVSDALRDNNTLRAANRLSIMAKGFGGGTKIGASLHQFSDQFMGRIFGHKTVVIIMSDGYDSGSANVLEKALSRLKKSGCKIVWLNPLLGWKNYEPVSQSIKISLPYIDCFAPCNTLQSLADLEYKLELL